MGIDEAKKTKKSEDDSVDVLSDFEDDEEDDDDDEAAGQEAGQDDINTPHREYAYEDERYDTAHEQLGQTSEDPTLQKIAQYINNTN